MLNIDKEEYELSEMKEKCEHMIDSLLDCYKKYPKQCEYLLMEMASISEELDEIEKEIEEIKNEIY